MRNPSEPLKVGDRCLIRSLTRTPVMSEYVEVEVIDIREPFTTVNWTSADQSKRIYKVRGTQGFARISRQYSVRRLHQLWVNDE